MTKKIREENLGQVAQLEHHSNNAKLMAFMLCQGTYKNQPSNA